MLNILFSMYVQYEYECLDITIYYDIDTDGVDFRDKKNITQIRGERSGTSSITTKGAPDDTNYHWPHPSITP